MTKKNVAKEENIRRMLERKRSLDYVSLQGLPAQTGCDFRNQLTFGKHETLRRSFIVVHISAAQKIVCNTRRS